MGIYIWCFTKAGFFSIVQAQAGGDGSSLVVRARIAADLDALREKYAPELGPMVLKAHSDYPYRALIAREHWARAAVRMASDIDYGNFKDEVEKRQGTARHDLYARVWAVMHEAEEKLRVAEPRQPRPRKTKAV